MTTTKLDRALSLRDAQTVAFYAGDREKSKRIARIVERAVLRLTGADLRAWNRAN